MAATLLQHREQDIVQLTLTNPGKLNAIDLALWRELAEVFARLDADDSLRCIVVRGADGNFAAGGDIEEFLHQRHTPEHAYAYHQQVGVALAAIAQCRHPTLAQIEGACVGGGLEIASQCDLRLAGDSARFGAPINRLGFSMYPGEMAALMRLLGPALLLEILLEGRILTAAEAAAKGLVTRVMPDAQLADEVAAAARRIASGAPLVARAHKASVRRLLQPKPLDEAELRAAFSFLSTEDYQEGMAAFFAKRAPRFQGR